MHSTIAEAIALATEPVALLWADERPENATIFKKKTWGCVIFRHLPYTLPICYSQCPYGLNAHSPYDRYPSFALFPNQT